MKLRQEVFYRIETLDGYVVRKKATRPYINGYVLRENGRAIRGAEMSTKPIKNNTSYGNWHLEKLKAVKI